jgi:hypothetical protein
MSLISLAGRFHETPFAREWKSEKGRKRSVDYHAACLNNSEASQSIRKI